MQQIMHLLVSIGQTDTVNDGVTFYYLFSKGDITLKF